MKPVVASSGGITLIGGGQMTPACLRLALHYAPDLVAADSGADQALAADLLPLAVIGDMDSISRGSREQLSDRFYFVAEQDSTDFEKALQRIEADFVLAVGFTGARLDHSLAALTVLCRFPDRKIILLAEDDVIFLAPPSLRLELEAGTRVSLFPMGPVEGRSTGLVWPIDGLNLSPAERIGTSNEAEGTVTIESSGPLLVMLPREGLEPALFSLTGR